MSPPVIRVYTTGRHAHRSPLSYPALRPLYEDHVVRVDRPGDADLYVFAHVIDIQDAPREMVEDWRARRRPVVLLSEEPFWDTIWGGRPLDNAVYVDTAFGSLPVQQINHHTSDIFDFDHLPYYLMTNHRFANAYRARFARNAARSVEEWQRAMAACPVDVSFIFERRPESYHAVTWPQGDIVGLCSWRTELAQACTGERIERLGRSWSGSPDRLSMHTDWHLDKLARLDGRARVIGALENTHQPAYITEKLFDAFACGGVPVYFASAGHWVHRLGLPPDSWINLYGLSPEAGAARIAEHLRQPVSERAQAMHAAQKRCLQLVEDPALWQAERTRLRHAVIRALGPLAQS